jgi:NOL1/NOP2/fmu family ribosome biogenesis protein
MEERFGIPKKIFSDYSLILKGEKIWIVSKSITEKDLSGFKVEGIGLLFARYFNRQKKFKPTTNTLQVFGKYATKNIVELNEEEKNQYIKGYNLKKELSLEEGYVIIKSGKSILGCGLYREGEIKNQIPKARIIV